MTTTRKYLYVGTVEVPVAVLADDLQEAIELTGRHVTEELARHVTSGVSIRRVQLVTHWEDLPVGLATAVPYGVADRKTCADYIRAIEEHHA
jgi:hypothetical protein